MKPLGKRMAMAVLCALTLTSPLFLSGCSMSELWQGTEQSRKEIAQRSEQDKVQLFNQYVKAISRYNRMAVMFDYANTPTINDLKAGKHLTVFNTPNFKQLQKELEEAKQAGIPYDEMKEPLDKLLSKLNEITPVAEELAAYYKSKGYTTDNYAKEQQLGPKYVQLYEQFIPMMKDCSPLLLELGPDDPGILVTQSVHKQQAGFSQTSQIHKKDSHIKGQDRYVDHKRFNNSFMMHASTSPFYPLFAALDVNAKMHEGEAGKKLWIDCVETVIDARKTVLKHCKYLRPLVPPVVHGKKWADGDTKAMAQDVEYFAFEPNAKWHSFKGYGKGQYFIDPCKFQLITPGIDVETGEYEDFGIPANILANYLRENGIIPEKCDLNTILFLMTPAESKTKMDDLVAQLIRFEELIEADAPMQDVLPSIYYANIDKYKGYHIRQLCQEMHDFYKDRQVSTLQERLFLHDYFPEYVLNPQDANFEFQRGKGELVPLDEAEGRIALEGALPYPPGVLCVQPGERWSKTACDYFLALQEGINKLPGFAPEIQGVYITPQPDGTKKAYGYVLKKEFEK